MSTIGPPNWRQRIRVIDSHTAGEPTRVIVEGGPDLGDGPLAVRRQVFAERYDDVRSAVVNEPRGSDVMVGGLLCQPTDTSCAAGVIFFNNVGCLNMCGHGMMGLVVTLAHMGRVTPGEHKIETPVGLVRAVLHDDNRVTVRNVPSYRLAADVTVDVEDYGPVTGDVAWGGNWFFLVGDHSEDLTRQNVTRLTDVAWRIRRALVRHKITGAEGAEIDHIELFAASRTGQADSRNFVLCPGGAYDRSPCGTGTSAKLACLAADGKLQTGQIWRQESIIGSRFEATYEADGGRVLPSITGAAYVNAEATLLLDSRDPFSSGIRG